MRRKVDFCADWRFIREDVGIEQADEAATEPVTLPHTWNAQDGTDGGNDYHRGRCWYAKRFPMPAHSSEEEVLLEFEGAAMSAQVFLNGNLLCTHDGGYATFRVNLTDHLQAELELDGKRYTIGALVLSNHAVFDDLIVAGTPIHDLLDKSIPPHEDKGSIITVLATDIPLSERQLRRLCRRALVGLSRTGSMCGNGSGEIVLAFTTANRVPHDSETAILPLQMLHDDAINPLFRAVAECVEESVLSSLLHAETVTGYHGRTVQCLTELLNQ